jgi:hypothetical protein
MWSALPPREERLAAIGTVIEGLPAQVYGAHDGLAKIQAEVRRLTAEAPKAPPTLGR